MQKKSTKFFILIATCLLLITLIIYINANSLNNNIYQIVNNNISDGNINKENSKIINISNSEKILLASINPEKIVYFIMNKNEVYETGSFNLNTPIDSMDWKQTKISEHDRCIIGLINNESIANVFIDETIEPIIINFKNQRIFYYIGDNSNPINIKAYNKDSIMIYSSIPSSSST